MSRCAAALLVSLCVAAGGPARAQPGADAGSRAGNAAPPTARFAIVIGNNLPARPRAGILRFADDDAFATHQLLVSVGVRSVLLARLDETSRGLHPGAVADGLPRWADLAAAFERLERDMRRERAAGHKVELFVFYSGHGDVAHGEGYVVLEDGHLTRTLLTRLLERSPANRNHVVIDACKSYFLAFEKGPGGHRARFSGKFAVPAVLSPGRLANTGFVLSTSSDHDSHEWERFQGGVFSHTVRSALLGAADADRDGRISYAELGAFLTTASLAVANPRYRPDFLVWPPGGTRGSLSEILLDWDATAPSTVVVDRPVGHVYVETAAGQRILDAHPVPTQTVVLRVPVARPLFVRRDDGSGSEYVVEREGPVRLSELTGRSSAIVARGAAQLAFEELFAVPFGPTNVSAYGVQWTAQKRRWGREAIDASPSPPLPARTRLRTVSGATALVSGGLAAAASGLMLERFASGQSASQAERVQINHSLRRLAVSAGVLASVAVLSGALWFAVRDRQPRDGEIELGLVPSAGDAALGIGVTVGRVW